MNRLMYIACSELWWVCTDEEVAQNVGMVPKYCGVVPTLLGCFLVIPSLYVLKKFILFATVMFEGKEKWREDYNCIHILYADL